MVEIEKVARTEADSVDQFRIMSIESHRDLYT